MRQKFKFLALEITFYRVYKSWDLFWGKQALKITTKSARYARGEWDGVVLLLFGVSTRTRVEIMLTKNKILGVLQIYWQQKVWDENRQKEGFDFLIWHAEQYNTWHIKCTVNLEWKLNAAVLPNLTKAI